MRNLKKSQYDGYDVHDVLHGSNVVKRLELYSMYPYFLVACQLLVGYKISKRSLSCLFGYHLDKDDFFAIMCLSLHL